MKSNPGMTVFIPVYNEEDLLVKNTLNLLKCMDKLDMPYEVILGSNGSVDDTVNLARKLSKRYDPVRFFHVKFKGVGRAFKEGIRMAAYERIVTVDMDLSITLDFISEACRLLDYSDIVIGSKITGKQQRSWIRIAASNIFISLAGHLLHINYHDYSIAAKGYRKGLLEKYLDYIDDHTFYVVEIVHRASRDGYRILEVPVNCMDMRESRFNLVHEGVYKFGHLFRLWLKTRKFKI
ncbi:MAG: glycosyltransferase family 2 protein [Deltaproteobacteria bacterium]|nr:glycosyltransferase family 2 protein [Deltaproteobacteria bacterium]